MPDSRDLGTAARISVLAKALDLSHQELAGRAKVSLSLVNKVLSGNRPPSAGFVAAVARALNVDARSLTGEFYIGAMDDDALVSLAAPIRTALDLYDLPPDDSITPRALPELRRAVSAANRTGQAAKYTKLAQGLPALLAELHTAAHTLTGRDQEAAFGLLAEAYRCGHTFGIALGMPDMSALALQRMDWAAQRAGDRAPGLRAAREYLRVTAYLRAHDYDACWRLNASGVTLLAGTDSKTPGALVARGQLHLGAAVIAARTGDRDATALNLNEAERIADQLGETRWTDFSFGFGPTNVRVHRTMTGVEAGRYDEAVKAAEGLAFPTGWLPSRIGHHHIDMARAYLWMNRPSKSVVELQKAAAVAPDQARHHPLVRDTVTALVRAEKRPTKALSDYAAWIGVV